MLALLRRLRSTWRKVFPRWPSSYGEDVAEVRRNGRGPSADGI